MAAEAKTVSSRLCVECGSNLWEIEDHGSETIEVSVAALWQCVVTVCFLRCAKSVENVVTVLLTNWKKTGVLLAESMLCCKFPPP